MRGLNLAIFHLIYILILGGFPSFSQQSCERLLSSGAFFAHGSAFHGSTGIVTDPEWERWETIEKFGESHAEPDHQILYRGQMTLTTKVLSNKARVEGVDASEALLRDLIEKAKDWREWTREMTTETGGDYYVPQLRRLEAMSDVEIASREPSRRFSAPSPFVSTSTSAYVAAGHFDGAKVTLSYIKFVYIFKVPNSLIINIERTHRIFGSADFLVAEKERAVLHDLTRYVIGVVDIKTGTFYDKNAFFALP